MARKQQKVRNHTKLVLTDEREYSPFLYHLTHPFRLRREEGKAASWAWTAGGRLPPAVRDGNTYRRAVKDAGPYGWMLI